MNHVEKLLVGAFRRGVDPSEPPLARGDGSSLAARWSPASSGTVPGETEVKLFYAVQL